jgi:hypothetical protein
MSDRPVLYAGDATLATAAGYLAGLMSLFDISYDYVPSITNLDRGAIAAKKLFIFSDYPAPRVAIPLQREIVRAVEAGAGLLMIGGWSSFWGQEGEWGGTPIGRILPVNIARRDDRVNCSQPAMVRCVGRHPICDDLPWDNRPPNIGGFNQLTAKDDGTTLLEVERFSAKAKDDQIIFRPSGRSPLLVVGQYGKGRTAAFATDLAPHWVGGLIDWGNGRRIDAHAPDSWHVEVGDYYARFVRNLILWTGGMEVNGVVEARNSAASH